MQPNVRAKGLKKVKLLKLLFSRIESSQVINNKIKWLEENYIFGLWFENNDGISRQNK